MTELKQPSEEHCNFEYLHAFLAESVRQYEELVVDQYRLRNRARFVFLAVAGFALTIFKSKNLLPGNKPELILIGVSLTGFAATLILF